MALAGWDPNKKLRLEIDYSVIDSTLTDFPIMVSLGNVCGKNNFDASSLFNEIADNKYKIAIEYGDSGSQCYVEVERWQYPTEPYTDAVWLGSPGESFMCSASSEYSGTYAIEEGWNGTISTPDVDRWLSAAGSFNTTTGNGNVWYQWKFPWDMSNKEITKIRYFSSTGSVIHPKTATLKASDTGAFSGEEVTLNTLEWATPAQYTWSQLLTVSGTLSNKKYLRIYISSIQPSNPGYGGVANWELTVREYTRNEAVLWVKVPSISFSEPTYLYLYYDNAKENNTDYVYATSDLVSSPKGNYTTAKSTTESSSATAVNKRIVIATTALTSFAGTGKVRIRFEAHTTGYVIDTCYIGAGSSTGNEYSFETAPVAVTFNGGATVTVTGSTSILSDWINYTVDKNKNLVIAFYHGAITYWYKTAPTGLTSYSKEGADETAIAEVTDYLTIVSIQCFVSVEEGFPSPLSKVWDDSYVCVFHTSQAPDGTLTDSTQNSLNAPPTNMLPTDYVEGPISTTRALNYRLTTTKHVTTLPIPIMGSQRRTVEYFAASGSSSNHGFFYTGGAAAANRWSIVHYSSATYNRAEYHTYFEEFNPTAIESSGDFVYYTGILDGTTVENSRFFVNAVEKTQATVTGPTVTVDTIQTSLVLGMCYKLTTLIPAAGFLFEFRISNAVRNSAWNSASYYSGLDQLVSIYQHNVFELNGYVQLNGTPVTRTVYLYDRSNGNLIGSTTSSGEGGKFSLYTSISGTAFINIMPELGDSYNIIAQDKITPAQLV